MIFEERPAPTALARVLSRVWFLAVSPQRRYEKILPRPFAHLIVNLSAPYRLFDRHGTATDVADAFVSGLQSEYLVIESPPLIRHVGVEFTPAGLHAMARDAPAACAGRVRDARVVLPGIDRLVSRLRACSGPSAALDVAEQYVQDTRVGKPDPLVEAVLDALRTDVDTRIGELADDLGVSHRTLVARFTAATGTTPKRHAQVLRFDRFVDAVHATGGAPDWALLAAAFGYYDQPHVIRAFHRFSGWTPAQYYRLVAEYGPDAAHFVPLEQIPTPG